MLIEAQGEMPGGGVAHSVMTLGYDPQQQRFTGTFIASMMTHLWVYSGALDATRRVLTLDTEGPDMADPTKLVKFQDIIELTNADQRVMRSQALGDDGQWRQFMTARYTRVSASQGATI